MVIFDTNILSLLDYQRGSAYLRLNEKLSSPSAPAVACTIISFEEQMRGWLSYIAASKTIEREVEGYRRLSSFLTAYSARSVLPFDERAAAKFAELRRQKIRVGTMDLKIAAIALVNGAKLITQNLADFARIPGLIVEDWSR